MSSRHLGFTRCRNHLFSMYYFSVALPREVTNFYHASSFSSPPIPPHPYTYNLLRWGTISEATWSHIWFRILSTWVYWKSDFPMLSFSRVGRLSCSTTHELKRSPSKRRVWAVTEGSQRGTCPHTVRETYVEQRTPGDLAGPLHESQHQASCGIESHLGVQAAWMILGWPPWDFCCV